MTQLSWLIHLSSFLFVRRSSISPFSTSPWWIFEVVAHIIQCHFIPLTWSYISQASHPHLFMLRTMRWNVKRTLPTAMWVYCCGGGITGGGRGARCIHRIGTVWAQKHQCCCQNIKITPRTKCPQEQTCLFSAPAGCSWAKLPEKSNLKIWTAEKKKCSAISSKDCTNYHMCRHFKRKCIYKPLQRKILKNS